MLRIGIVGLGFMGRMHLGCWSRRPDSRVVAVCDMNPAIRDNPLERIGNIEGAAGTVDFRDIRFFADLDEMLRSVELDAVSLTLPTYLHAECAARILSQGVHVLCEKPMAVSLGECDRMIDAADRSGKRLQIGHCIRFWPEYAKAREFVRDGRYGRPLAATFRRLGSCPTWGQDNWFLDEARSGGVALDLHIHDTDFIQHLFGAPRSVSSRGVKKDGRLLHIVTHYAYDDDKVVTAEGGWAMTPSFGFEMSFNLAFEKATVVYDSTRQPAFRVCTADGQVCRPETADGDGYARQIAHFADAVSGRPVEDVITLGQSRQSVKIVEAEKKSILKGRPVRVDD
jgi:1,5-anhydro-D-fructose reductase (1,5-anhydro-D-mannitol-forming)